MSIGVFGKLPSKRDFVQHNVPGRLTELIDPWMQRALANSRSKLGAGWMDLYLKAPIWRFWLGPGIAGQTILGAIMPSVDGVGRYFPLLVIGAYDSVIGPPEIDEQDAWYSGVERQMLAALAEGGSYDALLDGLAELAPPDDQIVVPPKGNGIRGMCATLRHARISLFYGALSYWWVPPGPGGALPQVMMRQGMPSPVEYTTMIAGPETVETEAE